MIKIKDVEKAIEKDGVYCVPNMALEIGIEPNDMMNDFEVFCFPHGVVRIAKTLKTAVKYLSNIVANTPRK